MRRKFGIGKKHIFKIKTKHGVTTTNGENILRIVEDFYCRQTKTKIYEKNKPHKWEYTFFVIPGLSGYISISY